MEKRTLLFVALSILIIVVFDTFVSRYYKPAKKPDKPSVEKQAIETGTEKDTGWLNFGSNGCTVETDLLKVVFSESGGWVKNVFLKDYKDSNGKEINLINEKMAGGLWLSDSTFNEGNYEVKRSKDGNGVERIEFNCLYTSGLEIKKNFLFSSKDYNFDFTLEFVNHTNTEIRLDSLYLGWGPGIKEEEKNMKERSLYSMVNLYKDKKVTRINEAKVKETIITKGEIKWLGLSTKYFLVALLPSEKNSETFIRKKNSKGIEMGFVSELDLQPGGSRQFNYTVFAGPKKYDLLKKQEKGLEKNIDFGFFGYVSAGLLIILNNLYKITHNYGLAILFLTLVVKIALSPLTKKSFVSMQKMQRLQPEIVRLQKKYKDDPKKLNTETFQLYRERKINPLGGCLPVVLQIPIFFALFNTLRSTIELRQAPFFGWIKDLSQPDTIFNLPISFPIISNNVNLLPVIMILSQVVQQKMVPSTTQTSEQKIMFYAMPVVFGVMFYNFPSGLVLYWTLNNIFTIIQQYFLMKESENSN